MGSKAQYGFTILETMLVLAVTALLIVGIIGGSNVAISQQRYRDSVNSLESLIQQQFSETRNVINARSGDDTCNTSVPLAVRGQSECVVAGRFIEIDPAADVGGTVSRVKTSNVLAYRPGAEQPPVSNAITEINEYTLSLSPVGQETRDVAWGAKVVKKGTTNPVSIRILIVTSPVSGSVLTFAKEATTASPSSLVDITNTESLYDICVDPDGWRIGGNRMAVRIAPYASSANGVQIPREMDNVCA